MTGIVTEVAVRSARLYASRETASERAVQTLRSLSDKVHSALAGETMRGMCNLAPRAAHPFLAAHATAGDSGHGVDSFLPLDGSEIIVIDKTGRIRVAAVTESGRDWYDRPIEDDDISAETLESVTDAMQLVLERHLTRVDKGIRNYEQIAMLADRIGAVLGV